MKVLIAKDRDWKINEQELSITHPGLRTKIELKGTDKADSLVGVGLEGCVLDEAALIKPTIWPHIIRPMLLDTKGWALFISTPRGKNWFYDLYIKDAPDWECWHYPTSINRYIDPEEIKQMQQDMPKRLYEQEVLAKFLDDEVAVFRRIHRCAVGSLQSPVPGRLYIMGVDLAKTVDYTVITVIDSVTREIVAWKRFQELNWTTQKMEIEELAHRYNHALCYIDATGVGDPVVEDLLHSGVTVEGIKFTNELKQQMIESLILSIEKRLIVFPPIEELLEELRIYEYELTKHGKIRYTAPEGKHDDCVISLALANWGLRPYLHEAQIVKEYTEDVKDRVGMGTPVNQTIEDDIIAGISG